MTTRTFAKNDRINHTSPDSITEYGTVFSLTNPAMPHLTLLVKFDDGTFCNVPASRCRLAVR